MDNKRKIQNLTKNTMLFMISSFGTKLITFLLIPLYTYVFSTSEYGTVDFMTTVVQLLIPVLTLNIQEAVLRYGLDMNYVSSEVVQNGFRIIGWSSLFFGMTEALILFIHPEGVGINYLLFLFFSYLSGSVYNLLSMYLKAVGKVRQLAVCGILNAALTCILNIVFLAVFHFGINGYMAASTAAVFLADLGMLILGNLPSELRRMDRMHQKDLLASMLSYSVPLIAGTVGWWLNSAGGRFILFLYCGSAVNGIYAASYKIPAVLAVLQDIFYNAWSVSAIEEFDKNDSDGFIGNVYMAYSAMSVLACSVIMMMNVFLVSFLYSEKFFESWRYAPILLTGTVFSGLLRFLGCFYLAVRKTKTAALTNVLGALINIGFCFILIPVMGAYGAAAATLLGYVSLWFIRMWSLRSVISMRVNWKREGIGCTVLLIQSVIASVFETSIFQVPFFICIFLLYFPLIRKGGSRMIQIYMQNISP